jgi:P27 family predicted phage terminase small subunit
VPGVKGRAGRKPVPTELKLIRGNPGKRKVNTKGHPATGTAPDKPDWLTEEASNEWDRVVSELDRLKMLAKVDRAALVGHCEAVSQLREATEDIAERGVTVVVLEREFEDGTKLYAKVAKNPAVTVAQAAMGQIRGFCAEFGLSPSARARMTMPEANDGAKGAERLLS